MSEALPDWGDHVAVGRVGCSTSELSAPVAEQRGSAQAASATSQVYYRA